MNVKDAGADSCWSVRKKWMLVLFMGVLALLIAGVGGVAWAQQAAAEVGERPVLFLGNQSLPPMIYSKKGAPTGIVIDLAEAMAKRMRHPVQIRVMDWSQAQQSVLEGRADALLQINANPDRLKIFDFSKPLLLSEFTIFTATERMEILHQRDLRGLKVGVEEKGLPILLMKEDPEIIVEVIPDFVRGFAMLTSGKIDAVVADRWVGGYVLAENNIRGVKLIEEPISRSESAIAVIKGNSNLLDEINSALAGIRQDGTYDRIIEHWRSKEVVFQTREQVRRYWWLLATIVMALMVTLTGVFVLTREIRRRKLSEQNLLLNQIEMEKRNDETLRILHDLEVSQTEIEIQNEELRRTQADLDIARIRYFDLYDLAPVGYCTLSDMGLILESNLTAATLLDVSRSALDKQPISRFILTEDQDIYYFHYKTLFEAGEPQSFDLRMVKQDGAPFWVRMIVTVAQDAPGDGFCRVVLSDITDRKTAKQDRIARRAAEEANRTKSLFLANMSHEIRTPMNAVLGFAHVLGSDSSLSSRQAELVRVITRSGEHLLRLISDILDMSKIEAGQAGLSPEDFSLTDLVKELESLFRPEAASKGLNLLMEADMNLLPDLHADFGKLRQILINLLGNAIKFTQAGQVVLRVRCETPTGREDAKMQRLVIEVEDTGQGIAGPDMVYLFDPFYQTAEGVHAGGTGLGLSISRSNALLMGGDITVRSRVGAGTCFRLDIPLQKALGEIRRKETFQQMTDLAAEAALHPTGLAAFPVTQTQLSPEMLRSIRKTVAEGDVVLMMNLIDSAEQEDTQAAQSLREMAVNFDYRKIEEWLERVQTTRSR